MYKWLMVVVIVAGFSFSNGNVVGYKLFEDKPNNRFEVAACGILDTSSLPNEVTFYEAEDDIFVIVVKQNVNWAFEQTNLCEEGFAYETRFPPFSKTKGVFRIDIGVSNLIPQGEWEVFGTSWIRPYFKVMYLPLVFQ